MKLLNELWGSLGNLAAGVQRLAAAVHKLADSAEAAAENVATNLDANVLEVQPVRELPATNGRKRARAAK